MKGLAKTDKFRHAFTVCCTDGIFKVNEYQLPIAAPGGKFEVHVYDGEKPLGNATATGAKQLSINALFNDAGPLAYVANVDRWEAFVLQAMRGWDSEAARRTGYSKAQFAPVIVLRVIGLQDELLGSDHKKESMNEEPKVTTYAPRRLVGPQRFVSDVLPDAG